MSTLPQVRSDVAELVQTNLFGPPVPVRGRDIVRDANVSLLHDDIRAEFNAIYAREKAGLSKFAQVDHAAIYSELAVKYRKSHRTIYNILNGFARKKKS